MLLALCGCADETGATVATYSAVVKLNDEPLPNAQIMFLPLDQNEDGKVGPAAYAESDEQGQFTLGQSSEAGASVGRNLVWVSKTADGEETVPAKYNKQTELIVDVPEGGDEGATLNLYSNSAGNGS